MSRIGKMPINIPSGASVNVKNGAIEVKGVNGTLSRPIPEGIVVKVNDNLIDITRRSDSKRDRSFHGLTRALINNMVKGVTEGFKKHIIIEGVGYKAALNGKNNLTLTLGYSHPIHYKVPEGINVEVVQNNEVIVKGADRELVGQAAVQIRNFRKPEPYKGKGLRYSDEQIRRKVGKAAAGSAGKK